MGNSLWIPTVIFVANFFPTFLTDWNPVVGDVTDHISVVTFRPLEGVCALFFRHIYHMTFVGDVAGLGSLKILSFTAYLEPRQPQASLSTLNGSRCLCWECGYPASGFCFYRFCACFRGLSTLGFLKDWSKPSRKL